MLKGRDEDLGAVILAGGEGSRLRPLTRLITGRDIPKQFCPVFGSITLLDQTRRRVSLAIPREQP
jgi:mannose-1-phosphate guanylyltransferase